MTDPSTPDDRTLQNGLLRWIGRTMGFGAADAMKILNGDAAPQLVIADIAMPDVNGYEFIRQVRALASASSEVPAVALSGFVGVGGWPGCWRPATTRTSRSRSLPRRWWRSSSMS